MVPHIPTLLALTIATTSTSFPTPLPDPTDERLLAILHYMHEERTPLHALHWAAAPRPKPGALLVFRHKRLQRYNSTADNARIRADYRTTPLGHYQEGNTTPLAHCLSRYTPALLGIGSPLFLFLSAPLWIWLVRRQQRAPLPSNDDGGGRTAVDDGSTDARTRGDVNFVATPPGVTFGGNLTSSFTRHYFSFTTKFRREHSTANCSYY